jgi:hypothetical protein
MADNEWAKFRKEQFQILKDNGIDFKGRGKGCKLQIIAKLWAEYKIKKQAKQNDDEEGIDEEGVDKDDIEYSHIEDNVIDDNDDIDDIDDDDEDIENVEDIIVKVAQDIANANANVLKVKENMRKGKQDVRKAEDILSSLVKHMIYLCKKIKNKNEIS